MSTLGSSLSCTKSAARNDNIEAPSDACVLTKFWLYETRSRFYMFGADKGKNCWKVLKIDRCEPTELDIFEDPTIYSQNDYNDLLRRLNAGNRLYGGLKLVTKAYGIVGFIKFLESYYILLITKRHVLGTISGHSIYGIGESQMKAITHPDFQTKVASSQAENRYRKLFNSINLTKDFFFSYTYRVMWSLQKNALEIDKETIPHDGMFVWNAFLTRRFRGQIRNRQWLVAIVHGFFNQTELLSESTAVCKFTLIARRSRHFAGTRYLKRGVNENGHVANDVEIEQLVHEELEGNPGQISSVVQHRGSIPLFWSQDTSVLSPRPDINLRREDLCYRATKLHFENLGARYGNPVIVLNLIKTREKKPREIKLCHEYANAIGYLNQSLSENHKIQFVEWDLHKFARNDATNVLEVIGPIVTDALNQVGFYCSSEPISTTHKAYTCGLETSKLQHGVLRANCIDCLDRTNIAQLSFGLAALGQQLQAMGLLVQGRIEINSELGLALMAVYKEMGDVLALQYGGSTAHNTVLSNRQGKWKAATRSLDFLRALRRHLSNAYTDGSKQDAINMMIKKTFSGDTVIFSKGLLMEYMKGQFGKDIRSPSLDQEAVDCDGRNSADWSLFREQSQSLPNSVLLLPGIIEKENFVLSCGEDEGLSENSDINVDNGKEEEEEEEEEAAAEEEATEEGEAADYDLNSMNDSFSIEIQRPIEELFWGTSESFVRWINSDHAFLLRDPYIQK